MKNPIIVVDTCVLISSVMRNFLVRMHHAQKIQIFWNEEIGVEWRRNAQKIWQISTENAEQMWHDLQNQVPSANLGDTNQFNPIHSRCDPKDQHVLATALACKHYFGHNLQQEQQVAIVTHNLKDFNRSECRNLNIALHDPDSLMQLFWQSYPELVQQLIQYIPSDSTALGLPDLCILERLKRERLFKLIKHLNTFLRQK